MILLLACRWAPEPVPADSTAPVDSAEDTGEDTGTPLPEGLVVTVVPPAKPVDECGQVCFDVSVTRAGAAAPGATVDVWVGDDCVVADAITDDRGRAEVCTTDLPRGAWDIAATATSGAEQGVERSTIDVRSFGWADGFERDETIVDSLPWTPSFTRHAANPVLPGGESGEWDSVGTMLPSVARTDSGWVMWYAGTAEVDYVVGAATSPDGLNWTRDADNPIFPGDSVEGSWKRYSTNSPMVLAHDGTWHVYYTGRAEENGNLTIGLASGTSPTEVADVPDNPVFSWDESESSWAGEAVAHPAVIVNDQGWWEMWYSTGYHKLGYAYSPDGRSWKRHCHNPVFVGEAANAWESNQVKAAEVIQHNGWYWMTYTGGDTGAFRVGWAMSRNGLEWVRAPQPILSNAEEPGTWESNSVLSAAIVLEGDTLHMWYAGTGITGSAIGYATASAAEAP